MLPAGTNLFRIYDPDAPHGRRDARSFRWHGPYARFDHHRGTGGRERRGIWYAGLTLSCAVVEAFDVGLVDPGTTRLAWLRTTRELLPLDLRGRAAMRAGTVAAISAGDHSLSQPSSRYFYEHPKLYDDLDGLFYLSPHNGQPAVALYERARDVLELPRGQDAPLADPVVLAAVRRVALDHGLIVMPPHRQVEGRGYRMYGDSSNRPWSHARVATPTRTPPTMRAVPRGHDVSVPVGTAL